MDSFDSKTLFLDGSFLIFSVNPIFFLHLFGGGTTLFDFSLQDLFKEMFGSEDPFADFHKFFEDVALDLIWEAPTMLGYRGSSPGVVW